MICLSGKIVPFIKPSSNIVFLFSIILSKLFLIFAVSELFDKSVFLFDVIILTKMLLILSYFALIIFDFL